MDGPEINERAFRFACRIVELYRKMRKAGGPAWELAPQPLKAGTSIGANLEEATGGHYPNRKAIVAAGVIAAGRSFLVFVSRC
jgi:four helix bundle protein